MPVWDSMSGSEGVVVVVGVGVGVDVDVGKRKETNQPGVDHRSDSYHVASEANRPRFRCGRPRSVCSERRWSAHKWPSTCNWRERRRCRPRRWDHTCLCEHHKHNESCMQPGRIDGGRWYRVGKEEFMKSSKEEFMTMISKQTGGNLQCCFSKGKHEALRGFVNCQGVSCRVLADQADKSSPPPRLKKTQTWHGGVQTKHRNKKSKK